MKCELVDFDKMDWNEMDSFADRTVFQTEPWVRFIAETQNAIPLVARLTESGKLVHRAHVFAIGNQGVGQFLPWLDHPLYGIQSGSG